MHFTSISQAYFGNFTNEHAESNTKRVQKPSAPNIWKEREGELDGGGGGGEKWKGSGGWGRWGGGGGREK